MLFYPNPEKSLMLWPHPPNKPEINPFPTATLYPTKIAPAINKNNRNSLILIVMNQDKAFRPPKPTEITMKKKTIKNQS
jgi:hypothetical protein